MRTLKACVLGLALLAAACYRAENGGKSAMSRSAIALLVSCCFCQGQPAFAQFTWPSPTAGSPPIAVQHLQDAYGRVILKNRRRGMAGLFDD